MTRVDRIVRVIVAVSVLGTASAVESEPSPVAASHRSESGRPAQISWTDHTPRFAADGAVRPARAEEDIREIAISHIERMAQSAASMGLEPAPDGLRIQSLAATAWRDVAMHEPRAATLHEGSPEASRIVWVVRGDGSFLVTRVPRDREPFVGRSGYLLIDDATGMILGMGTP